MTERGPWALARDCEATIERLTAEKATVPRSERRAINQRIWMIRDMLAWCKTREGYVEPDRTCAVEVR